MDKYDISYSKWVTLCGGAALIGALVFAIKSDYIIIRGRHSMYDTHTTHQATDKLLQLYYYRNGQWQRETSVLLWQEDAQQNNFALVQQWLFALYQEQLIQKKITLQSAIICPENRTLYLSFDRSFLHKEATLQENWLLIESLLKTLRLPGTSVSSVQLLVNHQPLQDPHLDCSRPWPLQGFLSI